jgi:hypothetical protein
VLGGLTLAAGATRLRCSNPISITMAIDKRWIKPAAIRAGAVTP